MRNLSCSRRIMPMERGLRWFRTSATLARVPRIGSKSDRVSLSWVFPLMSQLAREPSQRLLFVRSRFYAVPVGLSMMKRQVPSAWRRTTSVPRAELEACLPSGPVLVTV